jgi:acyl-homoserine lactone acylase PvdQ
MPATATAAPEPQPYRSNSVGGFNDVMAPGANGFSNGPQLAAFLANGTRPAHNDDQLPLYRDLMYASPGLSSLEVPKFFKDSSFGVRAADVTRTYSPRDDVTIVRDRTYGAPHVYGATRDGAMFGLGYIAAEDRLFFIDVLRNVGRGNLSSFAGGAAGNREFEHEQWEVAPYTEADLQRQIDQFDDLYGADGRRIQQDLENYVAGINKYISEAKLNPLKVPGEYAAIGRPQGPDTWKPTDVIATASLVGGIFGKGGGTELKWAELLQSFTKRFGAAKGTRLWSDWRAAEDPEAPTTVRGKSFPYEAPPKRVATGSVAMPDPGSVEDVPVVEGGNAGAGAAAGVKSGILPFGALPKANSNALVVSAAESATGRPLAVFGPQTGYFSPNILMEQDVHAPDFDARGASFPGVNLYVQLGHGRDYAWSATSAGQDIIDTYAVDLCDPAGGPATKQSMGYLFRGKCEPIEVLRKTNSWVPNAGDSTPPGSETLVAYRTKYGLVEARATIGGKPVAFTRLRSTYMHEVDSALGFADFNTPSRMKSVQDFQRAANRIGYTFNWLYVDSKDTGYFNSGWNPKRPKGLDPLLPVRADQRFEWRGWRPEINVSTRTAFSRHPQAVNQPYFTSWNNKQAPGYRAADAGYTSVYRSMPLDDGIVKRTKGARKITLEGLIDAMEDAATVDLRGAKVLPWALKVIGKSKDPQVAGAVATLTAWVKSGAHRIDRDRDGTYENAEAVRIMDAWWPLWLRGQFEPALGKPLADELQGALGFDNAPNNGGAHLGSAYQGGWYGYAQKDLRTLLGEKVKGRYGRIYCGKGKLAACRAMLETTLKAAIATPASNLYAGDEQCDKAEKPGDQSCFDSILYRPIGGISQPLIPWQNRPTYHQVVEVQGKAPR